MRPLLFLASAALAALLLASAVRHAWPHAWYPLDCCGGSHCREVACASLITHADSSIDWAGLHFTNDKVYPSADAGCHVCVAVNELTGQRWPTCVFIAATT